MRKIRRRQRCPNCKSLDVIRWGNRNGRQRYQCSNCGILFTSRRPDVSTHNRFVWFRKWVLGKQSLASLSEESGYSERQVRRWFSEYLENVPEWTVPRHRGIHLLIDGTWLPVMLREMGVTISSFTTDGSEDIIRAIKYTHPHTLRQRCLVHIERECLSWLTQHPRTSAGILLRRLVRQINSIRT